jgi:hypothetical protein
MSKMKPITLLLGLALITLFAAGCAHTTVESRKQERYSAFAALPEEQRQMVDQGQIKVGMPMDAVYIAWGKPSQVISEETPEGRMTTWLYQDTHLESYRYWTYETHYYGRRGYYSYPYLAHDYYPRPYVSAEVSFQEGVVKHWRTLPHPVGY